MISAPAVETKEHVYETYEVGYMIGSLAKASINRKLAHALVRLAPAELAMTEIPFRDLPLYSYDYDEDFPPEARAFKGAIASVDAVLFVTPEYNRSTSSQLAQAQLRPVACGCRQAHASQRRRHRSHQ